MIADFQNAITQLVELVSDFSVQTVPRRKVREKSSADSEIFWFTATVADLFAIKYGINEVMP